MLPASVFFTDPATTVIYTLSLHDALPISRVLHQAHSQSQGVTASRSTAPVWPPTPAPAPARSEEHTSELQSLRHLVCRLQPEKKNNRRRHPPQPQPLTMPNDTTGNR